MRNTVSYLVLLCQAQSTGTLLPVAFQRQIWYPTRHDLESIHRQFFTDLYRNAVGRHLLTKGSKMISTHWEAMTVSEATRSHLCLGNDQIWARMSEGLAVFLVLRAEELAPEPADPGYAHLDTALNARGTRLVPR